MNNIIKIQSELIGAETNSVNARELHTFIEAKQHFANWIVNRIKKYNFTQNQDYIIIETKKAGNNATLKEYYITLDMAKELSMVENNDKGRGARRYFIEVDKQFRIQQPQPTHHQIIGYKSQLSQRNKKIKFLEGQVTTLQKMSENLLTRTPDNVMELIDKGLKYDELNEKYKALDTQYSMFKLMGNEALNKIKNLQEQMIGAIPYLDNVLNNGMQRDKLLGWKPCEATI